MGKRILCIVGSRLNNSTMQQYDQAHEHINTILKEYSPRDWWFVSGGAPGIDHLAYLAAEQHRFEAYEVPARWQDGKQAGFNRNSLLVHIADHIYAIWDGKSNGTRDTIKKAEQLDKLMGIYYI